MISFNLKEVLKAWKGLIYEIFSGLNFFKVHEKTGLYEKDYLYITSAFP